jgi:hypothetical protein
MKAHRGNKSLMSILLNTLLLYPDHPYDFNEIWARAFDPQTKEYVKFLVTEPENLTREALYAKERALIADVKEELRQGRRCQVAGCFASTRADLVAPGSSAFEGLSGYREYRYRLILTSVKMEAMTVSRCLRWWWPSRAMMPSSPASMRKANTCWREARSRPWV